MQPDHNSILNRFWPGYTPGHGESVADKLQLCCDVRGLVRIHINGLLTNSPDIMARFKVLHTFPWPRLVLTFENEAGSRSALSLHRKISLEFQVMSRHHRCETHVLWRGRHALSVAVPTTLIEEQRRQAARIVPPESLHLHLHFGDLHQGLLSHIELPLPEWRPKVVNLSRYGFAVELTNVKKSLTPVVGEVYSNLTLISQGTIPRSPSFAAILRNVIIREHEEPTNATLSFARHRTMTLGFQFREPDLNFVAYLTGILTVIHQADPNELLAEKPA